jgi:mono/diheme cytochrome c family protein
MRRTVLALLLLLAAAVLVGGPISAASDPPGIKWVTAKRVNSIEGADIYAAYCQVCHGPTGRGNGPAARRLSVPVPDLSTICERDGAFNVVHVRLHVSDRHQHVVMPDWDQILYHNYSQQRGYADLAALNLARHIERLQVVRAQR